MPAFRWLILGPDRSGSLFHIDPNCTHAWNAVIRGRKKWIMFPPGVTPPGVYPSESGADVRQPISLMEWFLLYYDQVDVASMGVKECIVEEGECIFVPSGWWHCVINLGTTLAVTQNYVAETNLAASLQFMKQKPDQISGVPHKERQHLREKFIKALRERRPDLKDTLDLAEGRRQDKLSSSKAFSTIVSDNPVGGFRFNF